MKNKIKKRLLTSFIFLGLIGSLISLNAAIESKLSVTKKEITIAPNLTKFYQPTIGETFIGYSSDSKYYSVNFDGVSTETTNPNSTSSSTYSLALELDNETSNYKINKIISYSDGTPDLVTEIPTIRVLNSTLTGTEAGTIDGTLNVKRLKLSTFTNEDPHYLYIKNDGTIIINDTSDIIVFNGTYGIGKKQTITENEVSRSVYYVYDLYGEISYTIESSSLSSLFAIEETSNPNYTLNIVVDNFYDNVVLSVLHEASSGSYETYLINQNVQKIVDKKYTFTTSTYTTFSGSLIDVASNKVLAITKQTGINSNLLLVTKTRRIITEDEYSKVVGSTNGAIGVIYSKNGTNYIKFIDQTDLTLIDEIQGSSGQIVAINNLNMKTENLSEGKLVLQTKYSEGTNEVTKYYVISFEDCGNSNPETADDFAVYMFFGFMSLAIISAVMLNFKKY